MTDVAAPSPIRSIASTLYVAAWPALMFLVAGTIRWVEGWIFAVWLVGLYLTVTLWMHAKDPALLAERRRRPPRGSDQQSGSDRRLLGLIFLGFVAWIVLMPLEARRYHWTTAFPLVAQAAGGAILMLSAFFLFRAVHDNTFLSGVVRVQSDRGQHVVTTGVYAVVRHPMYFGMVLMFVGAPLLLSSLAGLGVAGAITLVLMVRITREERLLATQLIGYSDYQRQVRYRLLPLLW
jgi:protein-S-isoprenylcysteine O-methyltransferase Ste14